MPVPGATSAGNCPPLQLDGPALENGAIAVALCSRSDRERLGKVGGRIVRRECGRLRDGLTIVAGGGDRQDVRRAQGLQVGLEFEVAGLSRAPGEVDDVRSVGGGGVVVGVE